MIWDTFTFFNEFDILDIRLEELDPVVDRFVIVEGDRTFSGRKKPWNLENNWERYVAYHEKIVYVKHRFSTQVLGSWGREEEQRIAIYDGLAGAHADDTILISDADEIPRRSAIQNLNMNDVAVRALGLPAYYYGINVFSGDSHSIRAVKKHFLDTMNPHQVRVMDIGSMPVAWEAGWHFSYLGDEAHIANKFQSFSHTELNRADTTDPAVLADRMKNLGDLWGDGHTYRRVEIDDTWPEAIKRDRERWRKYER